MTDDKLHGFQLEGRTIERPPSPIISHTDVLEIGQSKADVMRQLVETMVSEIPDF